MELFLNNMKFWQKLFVEFGYNDLTYFISNSLLSLCLVIWWLSFTYNLRRWNKDTIALHNTLDFVSSNCRLSRSTWWNQLTTFLLQLAIQILRLHRCLKDLLIVVLRGLGVGPIGKWDCGSGLMVGIWRGVGWSRWTIGEVELCRGWVQDLRAVQLVR